MARRITLSLLGMALPISIAHAAGLPCQPCAGLRLSAPLVLPAPPPTAATVGGAATPDAGAPPPPAAPPGAPGLLALLSAERLPPGSPLFIAWDVPLPVAAAPPSGASPPPAAGAGASPAASPPGWEELAAAGAAARAVAAAGGTPWLTLVFRTPAPLTRNLAQLQAELAAAAEVAAAAPRGAWFQIAWRPTAAGASTVTGAGAATGTPGTAAGGAVVAAAGAAAPGPAGTPPFAAAEYAFLLKRAAVAVGGAQANVHVATAPLPADPAVIAAFYGAEVAAYVDLVTLAAEPGAGARLAAAAQKVHELDPGRPVALDALPYPAQPAGAVLAEAARQAAAGYDLALFRIAAAAAAPAAIEAPAEAPAEVGAAAGSSANPAAGSSANPAAGSSANPAAGSGASPAAGTDATSAPASTPRITAAELNPLALLAREFAGDLAYDPGSAPTGAAEAWAFVRGKDLSLRVIAVLPGAPAAGAATEPTPAAPAPAVLHFPDPDLRRPTRFPFARGTVAPPTGTLTPAPHAGLDVQVPDPLPVIVLGVERLTAAERQGVAEKLTVASEREMPVEEILKRMQVFEEAQHRRLEDYSAIDATHLRFQPSAGAASVEATLTGPFFWSRVAGADWAWESLYVNGVRWRGKTLPEIPLIQPEKAAAPPLEVLLTREYRYRLRGTEKVAGRDAWVVDFAPAGPGARARRLYQGTVWIDRAVYARLRTKAVELGLQGEVTSNEETLEYTAIDVHGQPAPWSAESFVLPLHLVAHQILSVLDQPLLIERETEITHVEINPPDFAAREKSVEDSDVTMVRDTDQGLRYLVKKDGGPRVVKQGFAPSKLFALGGLFVDDSLSYPLPLGGVNYFTFDLKNSGKQVNIFFAGALLVASAAEPRLGGTRYDAGADLFAIAVPFTDDLYQRGHELVDQEVKIRPATFSLKLGHPLGQFAKLGIEYGLLDSVYSRNSNTSPQFVLPSDNLLQSVGGNLSYTRGGYTLASHYSYNMRSSWHFWGLPGNPDFSPSDRDFTRYNLDLSKDWYLPFFQKIGAELDYFGGDNLDRFSKYEFGFFGGTRIHGYRSNAVRASEAEVGHLSYGFDFSDLFRLDTLFDAALATDKETGLHNTLLAGAGVAGSLIGPWQTLVTLDVGVPVAGPDHGFVLYLVFLKLFR